MKYKKRMKKFLFRALGGLMTLSLLFLAGCSIETEIDGLPLKKRTLFIYMAADNNLIGNAISNIDQMKRAFSQRYYGNNRIVIYWTPRSSDIPVLVEIKRDGPSARIDTLEVYEPKNSAKKETLQMAVNDMLAFAPADSYALVLWSHATGWIPAYPPSGYTQFASKLMGAMQGAAMYDAKIPITRSSRAFGYDEDETEKWMELSDLRDALPDHLFQFILIDACLMGQVEVAYALRNKADYLIASPAEVPASGMPYTEIVPYIFSSAPQLEAMCRGYVNYYKSSAATTGLYDLRQMEPLADVMSQIVKEYGEENILMNFTENDLKELQRFDRYKKPTMFDLSNFVEKLVAKGNPLRAQFERQMALTVRYKAATPTIDFQDGNLSVPINTYCGITTYIPIMAYSDLNVSYKATDWYKHVYLPEHP